MRGSREGRTAQEMEGCTGMLGQQQVRAESGRSWEAGACGLGEEE